MLDGFEVVYRAAGMAEAQIIKGFLESEEIPAELSYESAGQVYAVTMNGLGEVRVYVPEAYASAARAALARRTSVVEGRTEGGSGPEAA